MINGLKYIPSFIDKENETELLYLIDLKPWLTDLKRRTQHYGYKYDYTSKKIDSSMSIGRMPWWLKAYTLRLMHEGIFEVEPDQVIINEYLPGQGIGRHVDCVSCFDKTIASISLESNCMMDFKHLKSPKSGSMMLESGSLLVLSDEARYDWMHSIAAKKEDVLNGEVFPRGRRVSLTFRKVILT